MSEWKPLDTRWAPTPDFDHRDVQHTHGIY